MFSDRADLRATVPTRLVFSARPRARPGHSPESLWKIGEYWLCLGVAIPILSLEYYEPGNFRLKWLADGVFG